MMMAAALAPLLVAAADNANANAAAACSALKQQFPDKYVDHNSTTYAAKEDVNWYLSIFISYYINNRA